MSKQFAVPHKQEYVGLSNQGATCYMNSLLQTLYMTPEFRREVYRWKYDKKFGSQDSCIPLQLQLLFVRLQTCKDYSIETTALTKSFGWTQAESFQQHDVQEFCRVLFDAIEKSSTESGSSMFIQDLYEGTYEDYVRCSECFSGSVREDKFLDLSLTIKNQVEKIYNDSVEKALAGFVKPEFLTDGNQYYCETCKCKRDAQKGLKFKKLPYILVIQLKRYDYDYHTNKRIKINDKVSFEEIMNLNYLLNDSPVEVKKMEIDESSSENIPFFDLHFTDSDFRVKEVGKREYLFKNSEKMNLPRDVIAKRKYKEKKFLKKQEERTQKIEEFLKQGPNVYELYSIMIHSGSAWGGHYYAYIKSFEKNKWFSFNDLNVVEISYKEVNKVFGRPSNFGSSTSAYLLMYRQINPDRNLMTIPDSEISPETLETLEIIQRKAAEENQKRLDDLKKITVDVKYKQEVRDVFIKNDETVLQLKQIALNKFGLSASIQDSRLRDIELNNRLGRVFVDSAQLNKVGITFSKKVFLETKEPDEVFEDYDPSKISIKFVEWVDSSLTLEEYEERAKNLKVLITSTSRMVLDSIAQVLNLPVTDLVLFRKNNYNTSLEKITANSVKGPYQYQPTVQENSIFYVEVLSHGGKTCWEQFFEHESAKATVRVNLFGDSSQDKKIMIHPLKTLADLLQIIACKFKLPVDSIILKKSHSPEEFKDLTLPVKSLSPYHEVQVVQGVPLKPGQVRMLVYFAEINLKPLKDQEFFKLFQLFDLPVEIEASFKEFKTRLQEEARLAFPSLDLPLVRIREVKGEGVSRWLDDSMKVKDFTKDDGKKIAVQVILAEDPVKEKDDIIVSFKRFNPATWELEMPKDLIISAKASYSVLGEKLSALYSIPVNYT